MLRQILIFLLIVSTETSLANDEAVIPQELKLKPIYEACISDNPVHKGFCIGYFSRLTLDIGARIKAYDSGFSMGTALADSIEQDYGMTTIEFLSSDEYDRVRTSQLNYIRSCMSENASEVMKKFIAWAQQNKPDLELFYERGLEIFYRDTYQCDFSSLSDN